MTERLYRNEKKELMLCADPIPATLWLDGECVAKAERKDALVPESEGHPIYELRQNDQRQEVRERHLWKTGVVNFRDLGGYLTQDRRIVRYGCFYRSAVIHRLSEENRAVLAGLKLKTLLDFRSDQEADDAPDETMDGCQSLRVSAIPMFDNHFRGNLNMERFADKKADAVTFDMDQIYAQLPLKNPAYRKMFQLIEAGEVPLLFHCSAGKDRTGVGAALILLALGVPKETVIADYLYSNECRKEENERLFRLTKNDSPQFRAMMTVQKHCLDAALNSIDRHYPSLDAYFKAEFGLDSTRLEALRKRYCYPVIQSSREKD